jgi:phosphonate degradation associated HDIG domain protein
VSADYVHPSELPRPESAASIEHVLALYEEFGTFTYDEDLAQLDHALQTAALAAHEAASEELVVAALLHDVGHLLAIQAGRAEGESAVPAEDLTHEAVGARYLAGLFPPAVTGPIALHVRAKRYLCAMDSEYVAGLSAGSVRSLKLQGGPMSVTEVRVFERNPASASAVRLRGWDDGGKLDGLEVAPLSAYVEVLRRVSFF